MWCVESIESIDSTRKADVSEKGRRGFAEMMEREGKASGNERGGSREHRRVVSRARYRRATMRQRLPFEHRNYPPSLITKTKHPKHLHDKNLCEFASKSTPLANS